MGNEDDIPLLTDLIEEDGDITMQDPVPDLHKDMNIAVDEDDEFDATLPMYDLPGPGGAKTGRESRLGPELERDIRRILDEHLELAWQEIRLTIQNAIDEED